MKRIACFSLLTVMLAFGCGGGDDDPLEPCVSAADPPDSCLLHGFMRPAATLEAWSEIAGEWELQGDANFDCLSTPDTLGPTTVEVSLTGALEDFQTDNPVPDGTMEFFPNADFGSVFDTVMSDGDGNYAATVPIGTTKFGVKITAAETLDTYQLDYELEPAVTDQSETFNSVSNLTANALPAFIGVTRTVGLGILAGSVRDCDGFEISNAIATVSSVSGSAEHLDGAETYYFSAGSSSSLPVRHSQRVGTNKDALFVVIELPPTSNAFLQVWGYLPGQNPETDEMTLIAETPAPVLGEAVITASLDPLRT